jgi:hypothetical protein
MLDGRTFKKIEEELPRLEELAKHYIPHAEFIFMGCDNEFIYFNVVAQKASNEQICDISAKTHFRPITEKLPDDLNPYVGAFKTKIFF